MPLAFSPTKPLVQPQEAAEIGAVPTAGSAAMEVSSYSQQEGMGKCQSFMWPRPDTAENHYLWLYIFSFVCRYTEIFISCAFIYFTSYVNISLYYKQALTIIWNKCWSYWCNSKILDYCFTLLLGKQLWFSSQGWEKSMVRGTHWHRIDKLLYFLPPQPLHFEQN